MIRTLAAAAAAQSRGRFALKILLSAGFVAVSALVHREGFALALLVIFSGITGPAIRIVTLRTSGLYDRLKASPASKPAMVLGYTGIWSAAVFAALVPAAAIAMALLGPGIILPMGTGTVLAVTIGTLCGLGAKTLGDAHLLAILATVPLIIATIVPGPQTLVLPYSSIAAVPVSPLASLSQAGFLFVCLLILGGVAARM
jgi:hypothetical protein